MAIHPRASTIAISIICILAVAVVIAYVYMQHPSISSAEQARIDQAQLIQENVLATGTLSAIDWKKEFYADSGTASGTFKVAQKSASSGKNQPEALTDTDLLGREFFTTYVDLRKAGLTNDAGAVQSAANKVIADSLARAAKPTAYSIGDIRVSAAASTTQGLAVYGAALMNTLNLYISNANEAVIATNAFDKGDMELLQGIDPIIAGYRKSISSLTSMTVPAPLAGYHLDLLNGIGIQLFNAEALRAAGTDPVRALSAVNSELTGLQNVYNSVGGIQNYLVTMGVTFAPSLPGSH